MSDILSWITNTTLKCTRDHITWFITCFVVLRFTTYWKLVITALKLFVYIIKLENLGVLFYLQKIWSLHLSHTLCVNLKSKTPRKKVKSINLCVLSLFPFIFISLVGSMVSYILDKKMLNRFYNSTLPYCYQQ